MGEVYRAEDLKLGNVVALKFLPASLQKDAAALSGFHAEVRNARQVSHPNVCRVYDIGEVNGQHFLTMEYIDGEDLRVLAAPHRPLTRRQGSRDRAPDLCRSGGRARLRVTASRSEARQHHARWSRSACGLRTSGWRA